MGLAIRPATAADLDAIAGLHTESWQQSYRGALPDGYLDGALAGEMLGKWRQRLTEPQPGWVILVAALDDAFAGFLAAGPDPDDPSRDLIDNLHVRPGLRRRGIGAVLMREGAERLSATRCAQVILWVVEDNRRGRAFYRGLGGIEGPPEPHAIAPGRAVSTVPIRWARTQDIVAAVRCREGEPRGGG